MPGLDKIIKGGLTSGRCTLVSGGAGTGKNIFRMQYLYKGATELNELGIYISTEETREHILEYARQFGWDFQKLEEDGLIQFWIIQPTFTSVSDNVLMVEKIDQKSYNIIERSDFFVKIRKDVKKLKQKD
ncbi:MAG: ATPase domain-containing protein [Candidatus Ranarchaeia archaeon]